MGRRIIIIGAGGFAREVHWLLRDLGRLQSADFGGYVVSDLDRLDPRDHQVAGDLSWLDEHQADELYLGIGNPAVRVELSKSLTKRYTNSTFPSAIHPSVIYDSDSVSFGQGTLVCANNVLTVDIEVHDFAMINLSCTVGHEASIGPGSVMNPDVNVSGGVQMGRGVLVGTGAQILQYVSLGDGTVVGAGAVVTKDVASNTTVVGVPAKSR